MEWISVEKNKPKYEESVLLLVRHKGTVQGHVFEDCELNEMSGEFFTYDSFYDEFHDDYLEYDDVTHWMLLPEPPKE